MALIAILAASVGLNLWQLVRHLRTRPDVRYVFNAPGLKPGSPMKLTFAKGTRLYVVIAQVSYEEFRQHWPMVPDDPQRGYYKVRSID